MKEPATTPDDASKPVPLFGTWRRAYLVVVAVLVADIALLYAVARWAL